MRSTRRSAARPASSGGTWRSANVDSHDDGAEAIVEVESDITRAELDQAYMDSALRFLAQRPRSEQEIRRRLQTKGPSEERIERVLARLRELKLANDHDFAQYWTENRSLFKPRGDRALRSELFQKGVPRDIIDTTLEKERDIVDDAYRAGYRRAMLSRTLEEREFRERMKMFLLRRGFDWETIEQALERLWNAAAAS